MLFQGENLMEKKSIKRVDYMQLGDSKGPDCYDWGY